MIISQLHNDNCHLACYYNDTLKTGI